MHRTFGLKKSFCGFALVSALVLSLMSPPAFSEGPTQGKEAEAKERDKEKEKPKEESPGIAHRLVLYIPNRILDFMDIVRARIRVGPGLAAGARATKVVSGFAGGYASLYAGLPGPRNRPTVKLPVGMENYAGVAISLVDATTEGTFSPDYSPTEFGFSLHPFIFGIDIGLDPVEMADAVLGLFFIDIRGDDL